MDPDDIFALQNFLDSPRIFTEQLDVSEGIESNFQPLDFQLQTNLENLIQSYEEDEQFNAINNNYNDLNSIENPNNSQRIIENSSPIPYFDSFNDIFENTENINFSDTNNQLITSILNNGESLQNLLHVEDFFSNLSQNYENSQINGTNSNLIGGQIFQDAPLINEFHNKKWNAKQIKILFKLANNEMINFYEANTQLDEFFQKIYDDYILPINENYFIQYIINHDIFDRPIASRYIKRKYVTVGMIQGIFDFIVQSRKKNPQNEIQPNHRLSLELNILPDRIIKGGINVNEYQKKRSASDNNNNNKRVCKEKREIINMNDYIEKSRYIRVINADNFCLIRAILIGKAFADKDKNAKTLERKNNRKLNQHVSEIVSKLKIPDEFLNIEHIKLLESYFNDYQITVYDTIYNGSEILYPSRDKLNKKKYKKFINIVFENNHFNVITSMTAYLGCSYFCEYCKVKYSNLGNHQCNNMCKSCNRLDFKCEESFTVACDSCGITSRNNFCKSLHDLQQCPILKVCSKCSFSISKKHGHVCGENNKWCVNCKESVFYDHKCYIKIIEINPNKKKGKKKNLMAMCGLI